MIRAIFDRWVPWRRPAKEKLSVRRSTLLVPAAEVSQADPKLVDLMERRCPQCDVKWRGDLACWMCGQRP